VEIWLNRSALTRSVEASEGFSVVDALRAHWALEAESLATFLGRLNVAQRAVVAVAEVHAWAAFNGLQSALEALGPVVFRAAADGADELGSSSMAALLRAALEPDPLWSGLEEEWDRTAEFELVEFIDANEASFLRFS
jgi:hypothetical protein